MSTRLARMLLVRFLLLWLAVRALVGAVSVVGGIALAPSSAVSVWVGIVLAGIAWFDSRRRGERILLANLGIGVPSVLAAAFVVAIGGETALGIAWKALVR